MTNEELNTELYKKAHLEQETFRAELLSMSGEGILEHAYEYVVREDLLLSLEYHDLNNAQAKALLKEDKPLASLFNRFESRETDYMDTVWDTIECHADELIRDAKAKANRDAR